MAPHDTNTKREARRHWFPLAGMAVLVALVLAGFLWWSGLVVGFLGEAEPAPEGGLLNEEETETLAP